MSIEGPRHFKQGLILPVSIYQFLCIGQGLPQTKLQLKLRVNMFVKFDKRAIYSRFFGILGLSVMKLFCGLFTVQLPSSFHFSSAPVCFDIDSANCDTFNDFFVKHYCNFCYKNVGSYSQLSVLKAITDELVPLVLRASLKFDESSFFHFIAF